MFLARCGVRDGHTCISRRDQDSERRIRRRWRLDPAYEGMSHRGSRLVVRAEGAR
jgi:hypothetical protein